MAKMFHDALVPFAERRIINMKKPRKRLIREYKRGDVVNIINPRQEYDSGTHVLCGNCPAVIIQNKGGNKHSPLLIVALMTSKNKRMGMKTHVFIDKYKELKPSSILAEQLVTIDKSTVRGYITHLKKEDIDRLNHALMFSLGMESGENSEIDVM